MVLVATGRLTARLEIPKFIVPRFLKHYLRTDRSVGGCSIITQPQNNRLKKLITFKLDVRFNSVSL